MPNRNSKAGTAADSSTPDEVTTSSQTIAKPNVSGWHYLPEMPEIKKEVLVAIKYDDIPVQAYWDGKQWKGSFAVRDNMRDGYVNDENFSDIWNWIYAWCELPSMPEVPEPF